MWGNGQQAQLGRRIIERRKTNALVPERLALRKIVLIGTGSYHSFAVDKDGRVYAWGLNSLHQTGVSEEDGGDEPIIWSPTEVTSLSPKALGGRRIVQISGGEHHTLFLLSDGTVYGCGRCDGFEIGLGEDHPLMQEISANRKAMKLAAEAEGKMFEEPDAFIPDPTPIRFPPPPTTSDPNPALPPYTAPKEGAAPINPIVQLSAGSRHNLVVSRSGHVYAWGLGSSCQLGLGSDVDHVQVPTRVRSKALDDGWKVDFASSGGQHCALLVTKKAA